jgi:hypothetical protein
MIFAHRSSGIRSSIDPVAQSLRSALTAAVVRSETRPATATLTARSSAPLDLERLYPRIFAAPQQVTVSRSARALAFRLSVVGSFGAALIALIRH